MTPYGYRHRTYYRPRTLMRFGGRVDPIWKGNRLVRLKYRGGAYCRDCAFADPPELNGQRSRIQAAHLDGNPENTADENMAALCATCHRRLDLPACGPKAKKTRKKNRAMSVVIFTLGQDAQRPLLRKASSS